MLRVSAAGRLNVAQCKVLCHHFFGYGNDEISASNDKEKSGGRPYIMDSDSGERH